MNQRKNETPVSKNKEKAEIRKILQEVSHTQLIEILVEHLQRTSSEGVQQVISQTVSQQTFSGPIPDPDTLARYAAAGHNIADRIVKMAETQQHHRQDMKQKSLEASIKTEKRGQNYALIVALTFIISAASLIGIGKEVYGSILGGGTLIGLAYIFITGRKKDNE